MKQVNVVMVGHVDHGKSTVLARLMADTGSLPLGKMESIRRFCENNSRPFEYAYLLDALKDEQAQGITIEASRVFFRAHGRQYVLVDAPGHSQFLRNMISGSTRADCAFLVIDASEGIQLNSKRHAHVLKLLGIRQIAIVINKMDLVNYDQVHFQKIATEFRDMMLTMGLEARTFIPVSGHLGENITRSSDKMSWYTGFSILEVLESFEPQAESHKTPLRMPIQDVYKFTENGDDRRIIAGTILSGELRTGDELVFFPSLVRGRVKTLEDFSGERTIYQAGEAAAFTLEEQVYVRRGEVMGRADEPAPRIASFLSVSMIWLGKDPLVPGKYYRFKIGSFTGNCRVKNIVQAMDMSSLTMKACDQLVCHDMGELLLELESPVAFDLHDELPQGGRFVLVDQYDIAGGGIILNALSPLESKQKSAIEIRRDRFYQSPMLVLLEGPSSAQCEQFAKRLELKLLGRGHLPYRLTVERQEDAGKLVPILLDVGLVVLMTSSGSSENVCLSVPDETQHYRMKRYSVSELGSNFEEDVECVMQDLINQNCLFNTLA